MARRKNRPEAVRVKCRLAERLREVRVELFGERGGSEMARRLGLPVRTWYNYEGGVTVPAEVLLRFMELTSVEPIWLLHGRGSKYRTHGSAGPDSVAGGDSVENLLRTALRRLELREPSPARGLPVPAFDGPATDGFEDAPALTRIEGAGRERLTDRSGDRYQLARREWQAARRESRCVRVEGDAMAPILAAGATVAYADADEDYAALEGELVVAWIDGRPIVRWFERAGRFGVLRAENSAREPNTLLVDLDGPPEGRQLRRVLWCSTPH